MSGDGSEEDVLFTRTVRTQLRAELKRTGVTAIMLLGEVKDAPDGLTAGVINRWMNGIIKSAPRSQFDFVMAQWAAMPDGAPGDAESDPKSAKRGKSYPVSSSQWIAVTDEMAAQLRDELARTGVDHANMLDTLSEVPSGLTARIIKGWLYQHVQTTRAAHWQFVIERLRALPSTVGWIRRTKR